MAGVFSSASNYLEAFRTVVLTRTLFGSKYPPPQTSSEFILSAVWFSEMDSLAYTRMFVGCCFVGFFAFFFISRNSIPLPNLNEFEDASFVCFDFFCPFSLLSLMVVQLG